MKKSKGRIAWALVGAKRFVRTKRLPNSSVASYNVCYANYHTIKDCYHLNEVNYHDKFAKKKMIIQLTRNDNSAAPRMIANFLRIWHKKRNCTSSFFFLVETTGLAPLAARPAPTLSTSSFAFNLSRIQTFQRKAFCSHKTALLAQSAVFFALGHRKRGTYAFALLAPKRHLQCLF